MKRELVRISRRRLKIDAYRLNNKNFCIMVDRTYIIGSRVDKKILCPSIFDPFGRNPDALWNERCDFYVPRQ